MRFTLSEETKDWLIDHRLATVSYNALRSIMMYPEDHPDVIRARSEIMTSGPVHKILERQEEAGHWGEEKNFYQCSKYKGTVWNLIVLAELDVIGNERTRSACESILQNSQIRDTGGFSYKGTRIKGGDPSGELPCLTANMAWALIKLGMVEDKRLILALDRIASSQRFSATPPPESMSGLFHYDMCWRPRDCRSAAVKALRALTSVPPRSRTVDMKSAIKRGTEFILTTCLGHGGDGVRSVARDEWYNLGCPNMWNTDLLEIASVLRFGGAKSKQLDEVKSTICDMAGHDGRIVQMSPYSKRFLTTIERKGEPSGLLTVRAYQLLSS